MTTLGIILDRMRNGKKQILILDRNTIEIPAGKMLPSEDVFATIHRAVKAESGIDVSFIHGEEDRIDCENKGGISTLIEPYCVVQMPDGIGLIFLGKAIREPTQDASWIDIEELTQIITGTPERIHASFLAPFMRYLDLV